MLVCRLLTHVILTVVVVRKTANKFILNYILFVDVLKTVSAGVGCSSSNVAYEILLGALIFRNKRCYGF
jgi:hypothetical protein